MEFNKGARPVPTETTTHTSLTSKQRKEFGNDENRKLQLHTHSSSNVQHCSTHHRGLAFAAHNSVSLQNSVIEETVVKDQCPCLKPDQIQTLSCSSSDSSRQVRDGSMLSDLENERVEDIALTELNNRIEQVKYDSSFSDLEASSSEVDAGFIGKELEAKGNSYYKTIEDKIKFESEIEEFFAAAENDILNIFIQKYTYNFLKDAPMEGRYEWVPIDQ